MDCNRINKASCSDFSDKIRSNIFLLNFVGKSDDIKSGENNTLVK